MSRRTPQGVPLPVFDEITGVHEGAALAAARSKRSTHERLDRLETKHDTLVAALSDVRVVVGTMAGKLDTVLSHVTAAHAEQQATERTRIGSRAKVIVGVASALAAVVGAALASMAGCS